MRRVFITLAIHMKRGVGEKMDRRNFLENSLGQEVL
jgi:hypothetical protein